MDIAASTTEPRLRRAVPKADMHSHVSLSLSERMFLQRIRKRRSDLPPAFILEKAHRYYSSLSEFHIAYEGLRSVTQTTAEYAEVTQVYLERIAREGAIYAEISNSFRDAYQFPNQMEAISAGIKAAKMNTGIESRIVVTAIRDPRYGPDHALGAAQYLAKNKDRFPFVAGFGVAGDEKFGALYEYKRALQIAFHEAGLGVSPHVAEQNPRDALDFLEILKEEDFSVSSEDHRRVRLGHGTMVHSATDLIKAFHDAGVCFEICLSANKRMNLPQDIRDLQPGQVITSSSGNSSVSLDREIGNYFNNLAQHPILVFFQEGILFCFGSDNPLMFNTNIGKEGTLALQAGLSVEQILQTTRNAIAFANIDPQTRQFLFDKIKSYEQNPDRDTTVNGYVNAADLFPSG